MFNQLKMTHTFMNTPDSQEHQVGIQNPFFLRLAYLMRSLISWCSEHKKACLWIAAGLLVVLVLSVYGIERSRKNTLRRLIQSEALVKELRAPFAKAGEKTKPLPSYQEIVSMLSFSEGKRQYNGVILQEEIIAKAEIQTDLLDTVPSPLDTWPWKEVTHLTKQLEENKKKEALLSIQTLLQEIEKKNMENRIPECVGYLLFLENECMRALELPLSQASVSFETWKKKNPDLADHLSLLLPKEERH